MNTLEELLQEIDELENRDKNTQGEKVQKVQKPTDPPSAPFAPPVGGRSNPDSGPCGTSGTAPVAHLEKTPEARRAWSDWLCQRLHEAVSRETPAGLGYWNEAWEIVEEPSDDLLSILERWEAAGAPEDKRAAVQAADLVLRAWRDAARAWEAAGRPEPARETAGA